MSLRRTSWGVRLPLRRRRDMGTSAAETASNAPSSHADGAPAAATTPGNWRNATQACTTTETTHNPFINPSTAPAAPDANRPTSGRPPASQGACPTVTSLYLGMSTGVRLSSELRSMRLLYGSMPTQDGRLSTSTVTGIEPGACATS